MKVGTIGLLAVMLFGAGGTHADELSTSYLVQLPSDGASTSRVVERARVAHRYATSGSINLRGLSERDVLELRKEGAIVVPDFEVSVQAATASWGLDRADQRPNVLDGLYLPRTRGIGVVGCFLDSGILQDPQLDGKVIPGINLVSRESYPSWDTTDRNGHGHRMAGLFNTERFGAAPDARIIPVRVAGTDGQAWASEVLAGVDWCVSWRENNGRPPMVINMSLGGPGASFVSPEIAAARSAGVLAIVSAGNFSDDVAGYWPANDPNVFVVSASNRSDARVTSQMTGDWGSNFGPAVDIFAPGLDVPSFFGDGGGTSTAAALTSGIAALYLSGASLSPDQLSARLRANATAIVQNAGTGTTNLLIYGGIEESSCAPDADTMCLGEGGRFRVEVTWKDYAGNVGTGKVAPAGTLDSGLFYFFTPTNWELLIKVLDGCGLNGNFWVFFAATTDVEFEVVVTDTATGAVRRWTNALGHPANAVNETAAFGCG